MKFVLVALITFAFSSIVDACGPGNYLYGVYHYQSSDGCGGGGSGYYTYYCYACSSGTYQNLANQYSCKSCPAHATCSGSGLADFTCVAGYARVGSSCSACSAGTYKAAGNTGCTSCWSGSYQSLSGASTCNTCPAYASCSGSGLTDFTCLAGYARSGSQCTACALGTFKSSLGNTGCTSCSPGTYQSGTGSTSCLSCPSGSYQSASGASTCKTCPMNAACSGNGLTDFTCLAGYARSGSQCTACAAGSFKSESGNTVCSSCPIGTYQPETAQLSCISCPANALCSSSGLNDFSCAPGYTRDGASCIPCSPGTFKSVIGNGACSQCAAGTYQPDLGKTSCLSVPAGSFQSEPGSISYFSCPIGTFQSVTGQTTCNICPFGAVCDVDGLSDFKCIAGYGRVGATCSPCKAGTFNSPELNSATCVSCAVGTYQTTVGQSSCVVCSPGTYQNFMGSTACLDCPPDSYQDSEGSGSCRLCPLNSQCTTTEFTCMNGYGVDQSGRACVECGVTTYNPNGGKSSCLACPSNAICSATNFTCDSNFFQTSTGCLSCEGAICTDSFQCNVGFAMNDLLQQCVLCTNGTYKDQVGNSACSDCPANAACTPFGFVCVEGYVSEGSKCVYTTISNLQGNNSPAKISPFAVLWLLVVFFLCYITAFLLGFLWDSYFVPPHAKTVIVEVFTNSTTLTHNAPPVQVSDMNGHFKPVAFTPSLIVHAKTKQSLQIDTNVARISQNSNASSRLPLYSSSETSSQSARKNSSSSSSIASSVINPRLSSVSAGSGPGNEKPASPTLSTRMPLFRSSTASSASRSPSSPRISALSSSKKLDFFRAPSFQSGSFSNLLGSTYNMSEQPLKLVNSRTTTSSRITK